MTHSLQHVPPGTLQPWAKNPRRIAPDAVLRLATSIRELGWGRPILARPSDRTIVAGHRAHQAALLLGLEEVPVVWREVSDAELERLAIADNAHAEGGVWDDELLGEILRDQAAAGYDVDLLGLAEAQLVRLLSEDQAAPVVVPEAPRPPPVRRDPPPAVPGGAGGGIPSVVERWLQDAAALEDGDAVGMTLRRCAEDVLDLDKGRIPPFWSYYGGKHLHAGRYPEPLAGLPIVEPFAGSAGYACRHGRGRDVILVDADPIISAIWRWLISATPDDVLSIGDIPEGGSVDDLQAPQEARWLAGFWCNAGAATPRKRPSKWTTEGRAHAWGSQVRSRIADNLSGIRLWSVIPGDYRSAPDIRATWFVDPPYQGAAGSHYAKGSDGLAYPELALWCRSRTGLTMVCESNRADWLPWQFIKGLRSTVPGAAPDVMWCSDPRAVSGWWDQVPSEAAP